MCANVAAASKISYKALKEKQYYWPVVQRWEQAGPGLGKRGVNSYGLTPGVRSPAHVKLVAE
jgi:hypothetical protein